MKAVKYCMHLPQVTWLITKIKIDVSVSGDMSLYQGTFDLLIERCLEIRRQSPYQGLSCAVNNYSFEFTPTETCASGYPSLHCKSSII